MEVSRNGLGVQENATNALVGLDSTGAWINYSDAHDTDFMSAGNYSANASSWVQLYANSATRATSRTHTHTFTVQ